MNVMPTMAEPAGIGWPSKLSDALSAYFGDRFSTAQALREQHARGESPFPPALPDAVIFAQDAQEVRYVIAQCHAAGVPVIAHGAGSSLEGQLLAVRGGVSLDLTRMNRIVQIDAEDFTATVEPGVTKEQLNQALRDLGLFFPVDPGAHATLGGMCATRASGTTTVRYGTMRDNVRALKVVLADARLVSTGTRAVKSSAGYDLTRLFIGSEGTLGVITEITLQLYALPEAVSAAVVSFADTQGAVRTVIEAMQMGLPVARSEFLCAASIGAITAAHPELVLRKQPTLFVEFHGSPSALQEQALLLRDIAQGYGGEDFQWAHEPEARSRLWQARHRAYYACKSSRVGAQVVVTDTCVPISSLSDCIAKAGLAMEGASFPFMIFGHVGEGNFHVLMIVDPASSAELGEAERRNERIVDIALAAGGTCTGEHGIGLHKKEFLVREAGVEVVELMRQIKALLDPKGILNPGKIF